ncbi:MAG TPA: hypothetical protein VFN66_06965 [Burkholderiales bacterium]|nr:hypothetical protein [Burkholderiales bacterium]
MKRKNGFDFDQRFFSDFSADFKEKIVQALELMPNGKILGNTSGPA